MRPRGSPNPRMGTRRVPGDVQIRVVPAEECTPAQRRAWDQLWSWLLGPLPSTTTQAPEAPTGSHVREDRRHEL
jgi:hypothetical protein